MIFGDFLREFQGISLPDIEGLDFRLYKGIEDIPGALEAFLSTRLIDKHEWTMSQEELIDEFENFSNSDKDRDILIVEHESKIIGYCQVWCDQDPNGPIIFTGFLVLNPEWRKKGIGDAMLEWFEKTNRANAEEHDSNYTKYLQMPILDTAENTALLLQNHGYGIYRHGFLLARPDLENIPDYPLPDGLEFRDARPEHFEKIRLAWAEACNDMRSQIPIAKEEWDMWSKKPSFDPSLWSMVWHGDEVIGTTFGIISDDENEQNNRKRGAVEFISVRKDWRGQGIAKSMMARTMRLLKKRGMEEAGLGVDAENPSGALQLYEKMGFQITNRATFYRKEI